MRTVSPPLASRTRLLLQVLALVLASTWLPVAGNANEATPEPEMLISQPDVSVAQPTSEPLPTAMPTDVPPTPVPTAVPPTEIPTPVPTEVVPPTQAPTVEPTPTTAQAAPTGEPTPSPEPTRDPGTTSTPESTVAPNESTPASSPTPTPTPSPTANTDTLTILIDPASTILAPDDVQELQLAYSVTTERTATSLHMELRLANGRPAPGWSLMLRPEENAGSPTVDLVDATALIPASSFGFTLLIVAPTDVTAEHTVSLYIRSTVTMASGEQPALRGDSPIVTLTVRPVPTPVVEEPVEPQATPAAPEVSLDCSADEAASAVDGRVNVSCSFQATSSLPGRAVSLSQVTVSPPPGWTVAPDGSPGDDLLVLEPGVALADGETYRLDFSALPATCDAETGPISVHSTLSPGDGVTVEGPTTTIDALVLPSPSVLPAIDISGLSFGMSERTDGQYGAVTGTLAITIGSSEPTGCETVASGWSVQVGTSGLASTGRDPALIPAESFTYLGSHSVSSAPAGISPLDADIPMTSGQMTTIAFSDGAPASGGTWNAVFQLTPPGDLPAGSYEGGIDVVIINGP